LATVACLKLLIVTMEHERFGQSAEPGRKRLDQLELQLEELEASATEEAVAARQAEPKASLRHATRKTPGRAPLPAHLRRERVVWLAPSCYLYCGGKPVKPGVSTLADGIGACTGGLAPLIELIGLTEQGEASAQNRQHSRPSVSTPRAGQVWHGEFEVWDGEMCGGLDAPADRVRCMRRRQAAGTRRHPACNRVRWPPARV
jgi:hypothetical protein